MTDEAPAAFGHGRARGFYTRRRVNLARHHQAPRRPGPRPGDQETAQNNIRQRRLGPRPGDPEFVAQNNLRQRMRRARQANMSSRTTPEREPMPQRTFSGDVISIPPPATPEERLTAAMGNVSLSDAQAEQPPRYPHRAEDHERMAQSNWEQFLQIPPRAVPEQRSTAATGNANNSDNEQAEDLSRHQDTLADRERTRLEAWEDFIGMPASQRTTAEATGAARFSATRQREHEAMRIWVEYADRANSNLRMLMRETRILYFFPDALPPHRVTDGDGSPPLCEEANRRIENIARVLREILGHTIWSTAGPDGRLIIVDRRAPPSRESRPTERSSRAWEPFLRSGDTRN